MVKALLVLNKTQSSDCRIMVKLHEKRLQDKVGKLMREARSKEAFDLICSQAEVESYLPPGSKLTEMPQVTLIEDML